MMQPVLQAIFDSILNGQQKVTVVKVSQALEEGVEPGAILNEGMVKAMARVGQLFEEGEYFVPEMLIAARAMQSGLAVLKPRLVQANYQPIAKVAAGTVKGDLHDIGKNLVIMMLEGAGFEVIDLGVNVTPEQFIESVNKRDANIVAMSALLTTTMPSMKTTIDALKQAGVRDKVKILIGGAPITQKYAEEIGADGYSENAVGAVALAKKAVAAA